MIADNLALKMRERLESALHPLSLSIRDDSRHHAGHASSNGGGHYKIKIVSEAFRGKPTVACHRMIYGALEDLMPQEIHALAIEASAP
jgi:BolA protein